MCEKARTCSEFWKRSLLSHWHYLFIVLSTNETILCTLLFSTAEVLLIPTLSLFNTARHFSFAQLAHSFSEIKDEPHCRHFSPCQKCILLHQSAAHWSSDTKKKKREKSFVCRSGCKSPGRVKTVVLLSSPSPRTLKWFYVQEDVRGDLHLDTLQKLKSNQVLTAYFQMSGPKWCLLFLKSKTILLTG